MVQMLTKLKPLGRPKQPRPTPKLNNTTVRDFGGGLNVVDSEQNLTSKFAPVFDNMVTYTDRRVGPRYGYEMWLKLRQGVETSGIAVGAGIATTSETRIVSILWEAHPFVGPPTVEHVTFTGIGGDFNGITAEMLNRTHGIRRIIDANTFEIVVSNSATATGISTPFDLHYVADTHMLGGQPVECRYFNNTVVLWTSAGEIISIDRLKNVNMLWNSAIANALPGAPIGWSYTTFVAQDIFGKELICSNGYDKPLSIDFTRDTGSVLYLVDAGNSFSNSKVPAFDACKSAFRYFSIHDTEPATVPTWVTSIRIAAKDTSMVYTDSPNPNDAVDIDMSKITASPEQTVRGFATIRDTLLVIQPSATTILRLGVYNTDGHHDPTPVDSMNGFGSNAPRSVVEIGTDVFMLDFNGVPSARLSTLTNAVLPERVSNYIETMMSKHIGRMRKDTMRLNAFGFYDAKNKTVHFYIPKFDSQDIRPLTSDPFYFESDMAADDLMKNTLIMRLDSHMLEQGDQVDIAGAEGFSTLNPNDINGRRTIVGVLNENYLLVSIGVDLPRSTDFNTSGGGVATTVQPISDGTTGYMFHYVPQLKLHAWSRFKTSDPQARNVLQFNCGCGTLEGRVFIFTPDGYMMRYGSPEAPVYADWYGMYDHVTWVSGTTYVAGDRVYDAVDGLVYKCLSDVTTIMDTFAKARAAEPDNWEEYKGEPVNFAWELPWADFGNRQHTKALRFTHVDASGQAEFTLQLFDDNIYKNAANGQLMPARSITFVPTDVGAYGAGQQVYGTGRRTREQRLWAAPVKFKLLKARISGASTQSLSISGVSFLYQHGSPNRG